MMYEHGWGTYSMSGHMVYGLGVKCCEASELEDQSWPMAWVQLGGTSWEAKTNMTCGGRETILRLFDIRFTY